MAEGGVEGKEEGQSWRAVNRANWDERTPIHLASAFYGTDDFVAGGSRLHRFEVDELGGVAGARLVHLQCHFGLDTLSWARLGASVTGVDFSPVAIDAARSLAGRCSLPATFCLGDVYDAPEAVGHNRFDIVYTGKGALNWLPDIDAWAGVVCNLLEPGGRFYLAEFHPISWACASDELRIDYDYLPGGGPFVSDDPSDYADGTAVLESATTYEWAHSVGEVVTALLRRGLRLEFLHERPECSFQRFPFLVAAEDHLWTLPEGSPRVALMYSLLMTKPR